MDIKYIAKSLGGEKARQSGDNWITCCPCHEDHNPSLQLTEKDGKILWHCFAGCSQDAVKDALTQKGLLSAPIRQDRQGGYKRVFKTLDIKKRSLLDALKYPETVNGIIELLNQIKDIAETVAINNSLIERFINDPDAQQILRDDNEILLSIKKENIETIQHCSPELIRQAKGAI